MPNSGIKPCVGLDSKCWTKSVPASLSNPCQMVQYQNCNHIIVCGFRASAHSYTSSVPALRLTSAFKLKCGNNQQMAEILMFTISFPDLNSSVLDPGGWDVCVCWLGEGAGCRAHNTITTPSVTAEETWASSALLYCTLSYKCVHVWLHRCECRRQMFTLSIPTSVESR